MAVLPEHWNPEPPDPPVDESVRFYCTNTGGCLEAHSTAAEAIKAGDAWHPEITSEWQGTAEQGGFVGFYTDDGWQCPGCGAEGVEIEEDYDGR